ncbi:NAD-dependent epimerase/dehydratase family protein [Candidatus Nitrosotenuis cloacae]|uniref:NAD-dependent epimerase/dehydratase family protein n=1 Tax=Candidatus Nitrosotenuis cloacae TaxID=1603555 RepID=UPI002281CF14|nr:GDP-mannose 4,6-dehydratase [Candidatus Nitrosotenuis cloacae]
MITGGGGFVGSHLSDALVQTDHKIIVLTRPKSKLDNISHILDKITLEKIDITKFDELGKNIEKHKPDVIIHLAGQTSHSKSFEDPMYDIDANTKSTLFILEKIRTLGIKCRFLLGSTFIVIGKPKKLPVNEETPCRPTTIYGTNRLASEHYCQIYHNVYGLDTVIFRITNSFGPREKYTPNKNAVNFLIYKAYKGEEVTLFNNGKLYRDLIYISDVISAITLIMKKGKSGNTYWISSGTKLWFHQLGRLLGSMTNAEIKYVNSPTYTKKVDVGNFVVDNSKLRSLGWKPRVTIRQGVQNTIQHFRSLQL